MRTFSSTCRSAATTRKALVHFDRNGFAYTMDRATGEVLLAKPFVPMNWASGVDLKTGRPTVNVDKATAQGKNVKDICPSLEGGKNQQPAAFSPKTGLFYVPTNNLCMDFEGREVDVHRRHAVHRRQRAGEGRARRLQGRVHRVGRGARQEDLGHQGAVSRCGAARSRRRATSSSTARSTAGSRPSTRATARCCSSSRSARASSARR